MRARPWALGTAGFTAALAIHRMEQNGQAPGEWSRRRDGRHRRRRQHRHRHACRARLRSRRRERQGAGRGLPASPSAPRACSLRQEIDFGSRPLERAQFAGAIDNVGGEMLTWLTRTRQLRRQHREHRARRQREAGDHGDAVHPARRESARHQQLGHAARVAARGLEAHRHGPGAPAPGPHRHAEIALRRRCPARSPPYIKGEVTGRTVVRIG